MNLDDPKTQLLMMMGLGLLGGAPGKNKNFGADLAHGGLLGLQGYGQAKQQQARLAEQKQAQEMRDMQMQQMKQAQEREAQIRGLAGRAFAPGLPGVLPNDDEGNPMPNAPGGGMPEFTRGLMGIDPMLGAQFMPKPKGPVALAEGGRLVDPDTGREIASNPKRTGPQVGAIREIKSGGKILTYEWDGKEWKKLADAPQFKPEGPEKPAAPIRIDTPNGPMWVAPPSSVPAGSAVPVTGPDGKPIQSKLSAKEAADAEKEVKRTEGAVDRAKFVIGKVREAIDKTGFMSTGAVGQLTRGLGNTPAFNLAKAIDPIKANIGFAELQAMREASPTGGALGQVAVQELNMLQSVLGSLDTAQGPDELLKSLYAIEKHYTNWLRVVEQARAQGQGGGGFKYLGKE